MDIGFIGLGNMGYPMARRLIEAGHRLVVFDTSGQMISRLTALGATAASSPRDVADRVDGTGKPADARHRACRGDRS